MSSDLKTEIQPHGSFPRTASVTLNGVISERTVVEFQNMLEAQREKGILNILLDMSGISYVTSTGVGSLLRFHDVFQAIGGHLVLIGVASRVKLVLDAFGLDAVLSVMPDRAAAETHLRSLGAGTAIYTADASGGATTDAPETLVSPPSPAMRHETGDPLPAPTQTSAPVSPSGRSRATVADAQPPSAAPPMKRVVTVRYVPRMVLGRNSALVVMLSAEKVPPAADATKVQQVESARGGFAVSVESPVVTVLPRVPGCLCVPDRLELDVSRQRTTATFWLTPQAEGDLRHASVDVWKSGYLLDTLPVPAKVRPQQGGGVTPGQAPATAPAALWSPSIATESPPRTIAEYLVAKLAEYFGRNVNPRHVGDYESDGSGGDELRIDIHATLSETPALSVSGPLILRADVVEGVRIEAQLALYLDATPLMRPQAPQESEILPLRFAPTQDGGGQWEPAG